MPELQPHPWPIFENDPERPPIVLQYIAEMRKELSTMLRDAQLIGEGSFSSVFGSGSGRRRIAVKKYKKERVKTGAIVPPEDQQRHGDRISAPRIWGHDKPSKDGLLLYMDEIPGVNTSNLQYKDIPWNVRYRVAEDCLAVTDRLGSEGLMHKDLTPGNFRIDPQGKTRIIDTDFLSDKSDDEQFGRGVIAGTTNYFAPEVMLSDRGNRSDTFSLGVTLFTMITGRTFKELLYGKDAADYFRMFKGRKEGQDFIDRMITAYVKDETMQNLLFRLLRIDPDEREVPPELRRELTDKAAPYADVRSVLAEHIPDYKTVKNRWTMEYVLDMKNGKKI